MRASVNQGGMDTIYTYIQLRIHICVFVVIRARLRSENASVNEVGMDTINTLVPNLALFCMSLVGVASCGLSGGSGRRPNGVPVDPVLDPVVDSVVEEDPALVDSVVDPQLLSQAPGRSEGDQKLRQSRKRNHGSSLFLLCLNFGPCAVWLGPCGTSWGSTPGGVLYVPVALSLGLCFFSYESLAETKPTEPQKLQKKTSNIVQTSCKIDAPGVILE